MLLQNDLTRLGCTYNTRRWWHNTDKLTHFFKNEITFRMKTWLWPCDMLLSMCKKHENLFLLLHAVLIVLSQGHNIYTLQPWFYVRGRLHVGWIVCQISDKIHSCTRLARVLTYSNFGWKDTSCLRAATRALGPMAAVRVLSLWALAMISGWHDCFVTQSVCKGVEALAGTSKAIMPAV